jgi:uncharacterized alkaline shock family protein YloU
VTHVPTDARHVDRLPCGARIDDLLAQVADNTAPRDPEHQRTCRHCRATLAELTALWQPVHDLAAQDVRAPSDLLETVMAQVRQLPRTTWHATIPDDHGQGRTRIAARVVAAVARLAAQSVPEVTLALGGGHTASDLTEADLASRHGEAATDVAVAGSHVVIDVQIVVDYGAHLPDVARQVRAQITKHITALTGLTTAEVNINVADIRMAAR